MQVPFYVKYNGVRHLVVAVMQEAKQFAESFNVQQDTGGMGVSFRGNMGTSTMPIYKLIAAPVEGSSKGLIALDFYGCTFDGLVENCLMCGAPKVQERTE